MLNQSRSECDAKMNVQMGTCLETGPSTCFTSAVICPLYSSGFRASNINGIVLKVGHLFQSFPFVMEVSSTSTNGIF